MLETQPIELGEKENAKTPVRSIILSPPGFFFNYFVNKLQRRWPLWSPWRWNMFSMVERSPDIFLQGSRRSCEIAVLETSSVLRRRSITTAKTFVDVFFLEKFSFVCHLSCSFIINRDTL